MVGVGDLGAGRKGKGGEGGGGLGTIVARWVGKECEGWKRVSWRFTLFKCRCRWLVFLKSARYWSSCLKLMVPQAWKIKMVRRDISAIFRKLDSRFIIIFFL